MSSYTPGTGLNSFPTKLPPTVAPLVPLFGSGNPEGVIESNPGTIFNDLTNSAVYVKVSGTSKNGWRVLPYVIPVSSGASGASGGAATPLYGGTTAQRDNSSPTSTYAVWILTDSVPPLQISVWANGQWN